MTISETEMSVNVSNHKKTVGKVKEIYRYPIKSMRGEAISEVEIGFNGMEGDRKYAFIRTETASAFPWLTARIFPEIVRYQPYFVDPSDVKRSPVMVLTPEGNEYLMESEELLSELEEKSGNKLRLLRLGSGTHDAMPLSVISSESVDEFSSELEQYLDIRRFRPNVVVEPSIPITDFDSLCEGGFMIFGAAESAAEAFICAKDPRCKVVDVDPDTGERSPGIFREIKKRKNNLFGVYGSIRRQGVIKAGADLQVVKLV